MSLHSLTKTHLFILNASFGLFLSYSAFATCPRYDDYNEKVLGRGIINQKSHHVLKVKCVGEPRGSSNEPSCVWVQFIETNACGNRVYTSVVFTKSFFETIIHEAQVQHCFDESQKIESNEAEAFQTRNKKNWQHKPLWVSGPEYDYVLSIVKKHSN